jgi:hypothetical protein
VHPQHGRRAARRGDLDVPRSQPVIGVDAEEHPARGRVDVGAAIQRPLNLGDVRVHLPLVLKDFAFWAPLGSRQLARKVPAGVLLTQPESRD